MAGLRSAVYRTLVDVEKLVSATRVGRKLKGIPLASRLYGSLYKSFQPSGTVATTIHGHKLHLDPGDLVLTRCLLVYGGAWEPLETDTFVALLREGMVVIDIGAHIGYYTLLAARGVGSQGKVYAFEPAPDSYTVLCRNIRENGYTNVLAIPKAVSDRSSNARLYLSPKSSALNGLSPTLCNEGFVKVETVRLDDYFGDSGGHIDVLKIDTEGAEELILDGMEGLLKRHRNLILFTEFFPRAIQAFGRSPERYVERLHGYGFKIFSLDEQEGAIRPLDLEHVPALIEALVRERSRWPTTNLLCVRGEGLHHLESLRSASQSAESSTIATRTQGTILRV